eukprot:s660_g4.t1
MLLEHCSGGSLRDLCARQPDCRISEAKASWYFAQILQGVDFMHQNRCLHRDLKEELPWGDQLRHDEWWLRSSKKKR